MERQTEARDREPQVPSPSHRLPRTGPLGPASSPDWPCPSCPLTSIYPRQMKMPHFCSGEPGVSLTGWRETQAHLVPYCQFGAVLATTGTRELGRYSAEGLEAQKGWHPVQGYPRRIPSTLHSLPLPPHWPGVRRTLDAPHLPGTDVTYGRTRIQALMVTPGCCKRSSAPVPK